MTKQKAIEKSSNKQKYDKVFITILACPHKISKTQTCNLQRIDRDSFKEYVLVKKNNPFVEPVYVTQSKLCLTHALMDQEKQEEEAVQALLIEDVGKYVALKG